MEMDELRRELLRVQSQMNSGNTLFLDNAGREKIGELADLLGYAKAMRTIFTFEKNHKKIRAEVNRRTLNLLEQPHIP